MNTLAGPIECVRLFILQKQGEGLARPTIVSYERALRMFLETPGLPDNITELGTVHASLFTATLQDPGRKLSPGAIAAYQRPVWVFFRWLFDNDLCRVDIARRVRRVRVPSPTRRTATDAIRRDLITVALARKEHAARNAAIVEVLWSTGLRKAEAADLLLSDVDLEEGTVHVRNGKGGRERTVGIGIEARIAIERYILRERGRKPGPLFRERTGVGLTPNALRCVIRSLAASAGVTVTAHDFRRACASRLRAAGVDLGVVMRQLGHSQPTMTLAYSEAGETAGAIAAYHEWDAGVRKMRRSV